MSIDDNHWVEVVLHQVTDDEHGRMIREILRSRLQLSRKLIRDCLHVSGLTVNGKPAFMGNRVQSGDLIQLMQKSATSDDILSEDMPLQIYYEDEDLMVVEKPAGQVVHPTHGHYTGTLANGVVGHWKKRGEQVRFRPLHRIDADTSGLLAIAKSHFAAQKVSKQLKHFLKKREYIAIVDGHYRPSFQTIDAPIGKLEDSFLRAVMPDGKQAITHVYTLVRKEQASLIQLSLVTGRTHQIRVHLSWLGYPLLGDRLYGSPHKKLLRHALHASTLGIVHPRSGKWIEFHAPLPADMNLCWSEIK